MRAVLEDGTEVPGPLAVIEEPLRTIWKHQQQQQQQRKEGNSDGAVAGRLGEWKAKLAARLRDALFELNYAQLVVADMSADGERRLRAVAAQRVVPTMDRQHRQQLMLRTSSVVLVKDESRKLMDDVIDRLDSKHKRLRQRQGTMECYYR